MGKVQELNMRKVTIIYNNSPITITYKNLDYATSELIVYNEKYYRKYYELLFKHSIKEYNILYKNKPLSNIVKQQLVILLFNCINLKHNCILDLLNYILQIHTPNVHILNIMINDYSLPLLSDSKLHYIIYTKKFIEYIRNNENKVMDNTRINDKFKFLEESLIKINEMKDIRKLYMKLLTYKNTENNITFLVNFVCIIITRFKKKFNDKDKITIKKKMTEMFVDNMKINTYFISILYSENLLPDRLIFNDIGPFIYDKFNPDYISDKILGGRKHITKVPIKYFDCYYNKPYIMYIINKYLYTIWHSDIHKYKNKLRCNIHNEIWTLYLLHYYRRIKTSNEILILIFSAICNQTIIEDSIEYIKYAKYKKYAKNMIFTSSSISSTVTFQI